MRTIRAQIEAVERAKDRLRNGNAQDAYDAESLVAALATLKWCEKNKPIIEQLVRERK